MLGVRGRLIVLDRDRYAMHVDLCDSFIAGRSRAPSKIYVTLRLFWGS